MLQLLLFAQQNDGDLLALLRNFWPFLLMLALAYFLILMPAQKQERERQKMLASIKPNDRVVTSGGILGTVTRVNEKAFSGEDVIVIRVDERVKIEVLRSGIVRVVRDESGSATTSNA